MFFWVYITPFSWKVLKQATRFLITDYSELKQCNAWEVRIQQANLTIILWDPSLIDHQKWKDWRHCLGLQVLLHQPLEKEISF